MDEEVKYIAFYVTRTQMDKIIAKVPKHWYPSWRELEMLGCDLDKLRSEDVKKWEALDWTVNGENWIPLNEDAASECQVDARQLIEKLWEK
jgi:hypothetical protein